MSRVAPERPGDWPPPGMPFEGGKPLITLQDLLDGCRGVASGEGFYCVPREWGKWADAAIRRIVPVDESRALRRSAAYREWRAAVFNRDGRRCRTCGNEANLQAHHVKSFREHPELRFEVENGVTLCGNCHAKEHASSRNQREEAGP